MEVAEFARILTIGLGRAVLHLREHDSAPFREAILHACLHDTTYDRQIEGGREDYLFDVIAATGEPEYYRTKLFEAAMAMPADSDGGEVLALVRLFAAQGDAEARRRLYDTFAANAGTDLDDGAVEIVELDGLAGLLAIADRVAIEPDDAWYARYLLNVAEEHSGVEETQRALAAAAESQPGVAALLALVRDDEEHHRAFKNRNRDAEITSYEAIRARLQSGERGARNLLLPWGRRATDDELARAAADLLVEEDTEYLRAYLLLFSKRRFPLDIARLLKLVRDPDAQVAGRSISALANIAHPHVRDLGLELLRSGRGDGAQLLAANPREGDLVLIEWHLRFWQDRDELHDLGFGLRHILEIHPSPAATGALLALYERGPCSYCRSAAVEHLQALGPLPAWLVAECLHDANLDLRGDAREYAARAGGSTAPWEGRVSNPPGWGWQPRRGITPGAGGRLPA